MLLIFSAYTLSVITQRILLRGRNINIFIFGAVVKKHYLHCFIFIVSILLCITI
jgi:hypothetical protein